MGFLDNTCVKHYGRATLTVRRWGGLGELHGVGPLAQILEDYRKHRASADEVASTFVTSRIAAQSPSFSRETANPDHLLEIVAAC